MSKQEEVHLVNMFRQMTPRERQNVLAYFQKVVGNKKKEPLLRLVSGGGTR